MKRSSDAVLERAKVREVTGVFYSHAALEDAAQALLLAGFDRADLDRVSSLEEMYRHLGAVEVAPEELPDVPHVPRQHFIMREDITTTVVAVAGTLAAFAAMIGALIVISSGGGTGFAVTVAIAAGVIAGGVRLLRCRAFLRARAAPGAGKLGRGARAHSLGSCAHTGSRREGGPDHAGPWRPRRPRACHRDRQDRGGHPVELASTGSMAWTGASRTPIGFLRAHRSG